MGKYIDIFCNMECIIVFRNILDEFKFAEANQEERICLCTMLKIIQ